MAEFDFDKFLQDETKQEANRRQTEAIRQSVHQQLREADFGRVYDPDPEVNTELAERYAINMANYYLSDPVAAFAETDEDMPGDAAEIEVKLVRRATFDAQIRNMQERNIISQIVLLLAKQKAGHEEKELAEAKKAYLADLIVEGWDINEDIIQFYIRTAPGGSIDVASEEDRQHIVESLAATAEIEERSKYLVDTILAIADIIYVNSDMEQDEAQAIASNIAMTGYTTQAAMLHGDESAFARRESSVMEACRSNGLFIDMEDTDNLATMILDVLDANYPLTPDNL